MGQTGFCKNLRFSAVFCENLRFPAVFCENLRLRNAVIPRKSENQQKSAKICEKTANSAPFVPFSLSLLIPPELSLRWQDACTLPDFQKNSINNFTWPPSSTPGNASWFTMSLFTISVPHLPHSPHNQQSDGFPLECLLKSRARKP